MKIYSQAELARMFHMSDSTIGNLRKRGVISAVISANTTIRKKYLYSEDAVLALSEYVKEPEKHKNYVCMKETKCWTCLKSYNGCSWSKEGKPVDGWEARKVDIKLNCGRVAYVVLKCPEYEKEEWQKTPYGTLVRKNPVPEEWKVKDDGGGFDALSKSIGKKPFRT